MLAVPPKEGATYKFRVASSGKNATGEMWTGTLTDTGSGAQLTVGTLFYPHLPGRSGFGNFKVQSDDFLVYFVGGTCEGPPPPPPPLLCLSLCVSHSLSPSVPLSLSVSQSVCLSVCVAIRCGDDSGWHRRSVLQRQDRGPNPGLPQLWQRRVRAQRCERVRARGWVRQATRLAERRRAEEH